MRVAFDTSSTRGRKTGIGSYTESLLRALRALGDPDLEMVELDDGAGANQRTDRRILREQFTLPRLARQSRAALLHLTGFAAPLSQPCPVLLTVHDLIGVLFAANFPPAARFYWSRYLPWTVRLAAHVVADSENTRRDLVRLARVPAGRITVIYPGCDERFRPLDPPALAAARAELRLPAEFLLFVSTLEPRKGIDTLISAFAAAASSADFSTHLVIAGQRGWYWDRWLAQVAQLGLEERIHFIDYVPPARLPALYNLAAALVFPSRYEGFGLPPLEAMACGTPVLCANTSSLPEVAGDAGLLFRPDDVNGLAALLLRITREPVLRAELRARGLRRAPLFSWPRAARATLALYRELEAGPHARHA